MNERPTPDQIANALDVALQTLGGTGDLFDRLEWLTDRLRSGAVIVHPDDVPEASPAAEPDKLHHSPDYSRGWNDCRAHIFGGSHE